VYHKIKRKFSRYVYDELTSKNYKIIPVNPNINKIEGVKCYPSFSDIDKTVKSAIIMTPPSESLKVLKEALQAGIKNIWVQQKAESQEMMLFIKNNNIKCITNECIMMYAQPVKSFHKFHEIIWKVTGKYAR
jgi:predicted CoA-binding protein